MTSRGKLKCFEGGTSFNVPGSLQAFNGQPGRYGIKESFSTVSMFLAVRKKETWSACDGNNIGENIGMLICSFIRIITASSQQNT
jgi:hypothetical protein